MASAQFSSVVGYAHRMAAGQGRHLTDSALLDRFANGHDDEAFAILVHRHGGAVLGVCRRVVQDWHTAEDCFQAVFLVLASKAHTLRKTEPLAPWLHAVAVRVASKAKAQAAFRRVREKKAAVSGIVDREQDLPLWRDLRPALDEAIAHLPTKYRTPFILCYLHDKTVSEIARELGQPRGSVATRLFRAREHLRIWLTRRGIMLSAAGLSLALAEGAASASVPLSLASRTIHSATLISAGHAARQALVPAQSAYLMEGVMRSIMMIKLKLLAGVLGVAVLGTVVAGSRIFAVAEQQDGFRSSVNSATRSSIVSKSDSKSSLGAQSENGQEYVPIARLSRRPAETYQVGPGDTLGILVDGVLGNRKEFVPTSSGVLIGYPIPVRDDGTIHLPKIRPLKVTGSSIEGILQLIKKAYVGNGKVIEKASDFGATVTLYRKRTFSILVIRQDVCIEGTSGRIAPNGKPTRGTGQVVQLTKGENDLGTALARSGGMPGASAMDEVVIEKTRSKQNGTTTQERAANPASEVKNALKVLPRQFIRIPLKVRAGDPVPFTEKDITLEDGDVVFVAARYWVAEIISRVIAVGCY